MVMKAVNASLSTVNSEGLEKFMPTYSSLHFEKVSRDLFVAAQNCERVLKLSLHRFQAVKGKSGLQNWLRKPNCDTSLHNVD